MWSTVSGLIDDDQERGQNNRFAVAADFNAVIRAPAGPFWGGPGAEFDSLLATAPPYPVGNLQALRETEQRTRGAQSVWKLSGIGSVGSQALMGIPYLLELRDNRLLSGLTHVWPFETGCIVRPRNDEPRIILAEVYPSLVALPSDLGDRVKDRVQVETLVGHFAQKDRDGTIDALFEAPHALPPVARRSVVEEEGWILGVGLKPS